MGYMTPKTIRELSEIMKSVKNVNSDAHLAFEPETEPVKETWFDKYILRWF